MATEQPATDVPADAPVAAPEPAPAAPAAPAEPAPSEPAPNESHPDEGKVVAPEIEAAAVPDVTPAAAEVVPVAQEGSRLVLHHLNNSRSQRILWLLEELGVPYEIKSYHRLPSMQAPPELKAIHPLGKSPVMQDGDVNLAESGAIIEYLIKKYGKGRFDPGEDGWVDNLYYTHYAEGSLQPIIVMSLIFSILPAWGGWSEVMALQGEVPRAHVFDVDWSANEQYCIILRYNTMRIRHRN
ncbi:thioredoxin-like protein [Dacryopinax primogenitus]|uniref:glutathione transferase n=1 Tax=Dacryopinax primogenitus (strain DJM 731) TaxID=1858805 RepID=M5FZC3_DACPD|nr:thioredoxin-like protein [Dacryopinax primogenitus]EJU03396.1 thioredoxin-like protein [Dacryopinax primogenitus]